MTSSTLKHLRFPFSLFLLPIYLAALASAESIDALRALEAFLIIHLLLYPASNGFNSWYDRDTGPIGGLERPPPVEKSLLVVSLLLDLLALVAGLWLLGPLFALGLLGYGTASKLYSWDRTRLKARPVTGWLMTGLGQGGLTFVLVLLAVDPRGLGAIDAGALYRSLAVALLLLGIFPLTQIYQHEEDAARGDLTISRLVGVRGTFLLSGLCLGLGILGLGYVVFTQSGRLWALVFIAFQTPAIVFFAIWFLKVLRDETAADFRAAMGMNLFASGLLNAFYLSYLALERLGRFA
jgi:1,4-dihydroxy-2-naphthoate octaprenyltransferase